MIDRELHDSVHGNYTPYYGIGIVYNDTTVQERVLHTPYSFLP